MRWETLLIWRGKSMVKLPFGFVRAEDSPGFLLWQATTIWQRQIKKALEDYDISHAQFVIMATLMWFEAHGYETTQVLIINWTKLDKMTVSQSLKKLVARKLAKRMEHARDTRAKKVLLTASGKKLVEKLVPMVEKIDHKFFAKIPSLQEQKLIEMLTKLVNEN
jgi:DNA-binding MarR family transcriptional regulator